jgi:hypothetical protein
VASRKEEKERLRRAREEAEAGSTRQERKRLLLGYVVAGLISLAVVAGIVFAIAGGGDGGSGGGSAGSSDRVNETFGLVPEGVAVDDRDSADAPSDGNTTDLEAAAEAASCELLTEQKDEGNTHIEGNELPNYATNPPTSGDHSPDPLADGAFADAPSPLNYIHALEHGRIEIQYQPNLPEADQLQLLGLYDEDSAGMILFPNGEMPYEVAATAWRQTLGCDSYEGAATLDAIRAFTSQYRARGPEPIAMS